MFGQKDYQQLVLIRRMAPTSVCGVEVVGGRDGARGRRSGVELVATATSTAETRAALGVAARAAAGRRGSGGARAGAARGAARAVLDWRDPASRSTTWRSPTPTSASWRRRTRRRHEARLLVAARVGTTRLIDNLPVSLGLTLTKARGVTFSPPRSHI